MNVKDRMPILLLVLYIFVGVFIQYDGLSQFKSLPSPIYGGDYYYSMGAVWHIREGGNPLESSSMLGGLPSQLIVYPFLCAKFCDLFNLETMKGMFYFSLVIFVVASVIWFYLFRVLFKDDWIALIGVVLANGINAYPILKYTPFTHQIMLPLFVLCMYLTFKERKLVYYVLFGVIYGLLALSNINCFIGATIVLATYILYEIYKAYTNGEIINYLKGHLKNWVLFAIVAFPILMIYWYKPIFVYHLHMVYDRPHLDWPDMSRLDLQLKFLWNTIVSYLFNFKSFEKLITTLLVWIGIYAYYNSENSILKEFLKIFALGSIFATFCYFITEPLLHTNFIPGRISDFFLWMLSILIGLYGLNYIRNNYLSMEKSVLNKTAVFGILYLVLFSNSAFAFVNYMNNDIWANTGKHPMPPQYISLQKYLLKNTDVNDVILSTKEISFAINAISGRKVVVSRWAHQNDPFMDLSQRDVDAAIILYGNDTKKKLELIKKYHIKYLYWDYYWINSEFQFDKSGRIVGMFDPLIAFNEPKYKHQLDRYGIKYFRIKYWIDPAGRSKDIRRFDILVVSPQNYHNFTNPWKPDLNKYLTEVWNYTYNGQKIAVLYRIDIN